MGAVNGCMRTLCHRAAERCPTLGAGMLLGAGRLCRGGSRAAAGCCWRIRLCCSGIPHASLLLCEGVESASNQFGFIMFFSFILTPLGSVT